MSEYEKYRWRWENYPKLYRVDRVPIHLDLELTTRCNLKCIMCPRTFNNIPIMNMDFDLVKRIISEFAEKGGNSIKFVYLGEALMYPFIFETIAYAKKKGIVDTMIATNGTLITKKFAIKLIKSGLDFIIFSIDSCYPEIYKQIRINGNLESVIKGLEFINQLKRFYGLKTPRIQIQIIPMDLNKEEIKSGEYERFFKPYADIIRIAPYLENYFIEEPIGETPDFFCGQVWQRMTIRADGKVQMCCGERKEDKIVGDINISNIEEIWTNERFNEIRKLMKERKSHLIRGCETCSGRLH